MLPLLAGLAHHSEPGDPELMAWIKDRIDALVGLEAEAIVIVLGAIIVTIPLAIMALYVVHSALQRRA